MSPRAEAPVPSTETLVPAKIQGFPSRWGSRPREQNLPSPPTHPAVPSIGTSRPRQKQLQSPRGPPFRSRGPNGRREGTSGMTRGDPSFVRPYLRLVRGEGSPRTRGPQGVFEGTAASVRGEVRSCRRGRERALRGTLAPFADFRDGVAPSTTVLARPTAAAPPSTVTPAPHTAAAVIRPPETADHDGRDTHSLGPHGGASPSLRTRSQPGPTSGG